MKTILLTALMLSSACAIDYGEYDCQVTQLSNIDQYEEDNWGIKNGKINDGDIYSINYQKNKLEFENKTNEAKQIFTKMERDHETSHFTNKWYSFTIWHDSDVFLFSVNKANNSVGYGGNCKKVMY